MCGRKTAIKKRRVLKAFPGAILGSAGHSPRVKKRDSHCTVVQHQSSTLSRPNGSGIDVRAHFGRNIEVPKQKYQ